MSRCNECYGTGKYALELGYQTYMYTCPHCEGTGKMVVESAETSLIGSGRSYRSNIRDSAICPHCNGTGEVGKSKQGMALTEQQRPTCLKHDCDKPLLHVKGGVWRCEDGHEAWTFLSPDEIRELGEKGSPQQTNQLTMEEIRFLCSELVRAEFRKNPQWVGLADSILTRLCAQHSELFCSVQQPPEPTPNVAWVKSALQDCCRNKDISRETAKEIVAALLRDTGGIDFDHAAVTPTEEEEPAAYWILQGDCRPAAVALLLRIADELDEYGSERAAQHLRNHAKKLKEESSD